MPSDTLIPSDRRGNPQVIVDALMRMLQEQFPVVISGAAVSAAVIQQLTKQVVDVVRKNIAILGGVLTTAGLAMLLPSLAVALVNLVGFTTTGVVGGALSLQKSNVEVLTITLHYSYTGSLAALIQSSVYGGSASGVFSMLQSFGATSAIAPPVALALGGAFLILGAGAVGYWFWQRRFGGSDSGSDSDDELDSDDESRGDDKHPPKENQALIKTVSVS